MCCIISFYCISAHYWVKAGVNTSISAEEHIISIWWCIKKGFCCLFSRKFLEFIFLGNEKVYFSMLMSVYEMFQ